MNSQNNNNVKSKKQNDFLIKSASYASVTIATIIMSIKLFGWFHTDSQSMLASLIDSLLDISSSVINLIAIRIALVPPDNNHRFGHDKFQDLAVFSQSIFFFASCMFTIFSSSRALYYQEAPANVHIGANIMYVCIALTFFLVCYQTYVLKRTKSKIIEADKLHYFSDFLTNIAVVLSLYFSRDYWYIDALAGIGISIYIIYGSYVLFRSSIHNLADEEFVQEDKDKIMKVIGKYKESKGVHELKTRSAGNKQFIQFHLELDGNMSLFEAHNISYKMAQDLRKTFPGSEVIIHQDPEGLETEVQYVEHISKQ